MPPAVRHFRPAASSRLLLAALALLAILCAVPAHACGGGEACVVDGGFYLVRPPSAWDGKTALPAVVFFHGYRESARSVMAHEDFVARMDRLGVLLIAPHGEGETWSYPGSPARNRDEFAFVDAVLTDVATRFPIDPKRLVASGFSQGGSMVWYLACRMGGRFAAFAPIAGAFWRPHPTRCDGGPVFLSHTHGLNDRTVPMEGRELRGGQYRQGDVREGLKIFLRNDACEAPPAASSDGVLTCEIWSGCGSGREIRLCLHAGGHDFDPRFVEDAMRDVERRAASP